MWLAQTITQFFTFSGLKPNIKKSEIASLGVLERFSVTVCAIKCIDLEIETIKILGTLLSHNETWKNYTYWYAKIKYTYWYANCLKIGAREATRNLREKLMCLKVIKKCNPKQFLTFRYLKSNEVVCELQYIQKSFS